MGRLSPKCRFREETRLGFPRPSRPVAPSMFPRAARKCCSLEPHAAAVLGLCGRNPGLAAHRGASVTCLRMAQPGRPMDERSHTTENRASTLSMPMAPVRIGSPHSRPTLEYQPPVHDGPPTGKFCGSKLLIPRAS